MRILHVLESLAAGGIETTFLHVLRALRRLDASVSHDVLACEGGPLEAAFREVCRDLRVVPDWQAAEVSRLSQADLVHVLFERCAYRILPDLLARSAVPVVYGKGYDMGGMYRANEGLRWSSDVALLAACDRVTFTTESLAAAFGATSRPTAVVGKAAAVDRFVTIAPAEQDAPPLILCVANVHPRKRIVDLVDALALVRMVVPDAHLRVVGACDAAARAVVEAHARRAGVEEAVVLAGQRADIAGEVASCRLLALPSSCEGVPTVLLEAMAAARPVVATRTGHVESIVTDGTEGFLVDVGDVAALAGRICRILTEPALAGRMGAAARTRAAGHDVSLVAARLLNVFAQAVAPPGVAA